ncbi:MAG TPA: four-carbon acid sugar kinase family protein [Epulopiscium sp.]|nr:four-carbon acid sugar kinase family protein [Candidatus Epulonipiscium sp.]
MPQCVVIADDLTGANATGVQIKKLNYNAYTVMNTERLELSRLAESDCIIYPTDSRGIESEIAYNRVYNVTKLLMSDEVLVYSKRIDSTLRGNLGRETDALLDALNNGAIAMVVPCFPEANRILVGGYLLVDLIPLHKTSAATDPKTPVNTSSASELFSNQSKYPVASLHINDLMKGKKHIAQRIKVLKEDGIRIIIFDSISQEDIDLIADGIIESGVNFIAVDPGSFTATVTRKLIVPRKEVKELKMLATVGSVNPIAKLQVDELLLAQEVFNIYAKTGEFVESEHRRAKEIDRVVNEILKGCDHYEICTVIGDGIMPQNRLDFEKHAKRYNCTMDEVSEMINASFAEITYQILKRDSSFQGIYTSGGDITVAVSKRLKTIGIRLLDEVIPLAAYGEFIDGEFDGLKIITKGGMAGDKNSMNICMRYMKERLYT